MCTNWNMEEKVWQQSFVSFTLILKLKIHAQILWLGYVQHILQQYRQLHICVYVCVSFGPSILQATNYSMPRDKPLNEEFQYILC